MSILYVGYCYHIYNVEFQELMVRQSRILHSVLLVMESLLFGMFVIAIACDQFDAIFTGRRYLTASYLCFSSYLVPVFAAAKGLFTVVEDRNVFQLN